MLAWGSAEEPPPPNLGDSAGSKLGNRYRAIERQRESIVLLNTSAKRAASALPTVVGRYRNLARKTVVTELAEIFEYLSSERAERRVRGKDHSERGKEYGPFWDFVVAVWTPIYGSTRGLNDLMKEWATHRNRGKTESHVIAAMRRDHPEWGI